jgi:hypothetical protein
VENRYQSQLILARTDVDKQVEPFRSPTRSVEKFSCDKLILVFHNHVLKHPEECKTLGKFAAALATKLINRAVKNYFCRLSARSSNSL